MSSHCQVINYRLEELCKKALKNIDRRREIEAQNHLLEFQNRYNKKRQWFRKMLFFGIPKLENISKEEAHAIILFRKENGTTWDRIEHMDYPKYKHVWKDNELVILRLTSLLEVCFADMTITAEDAGYLMAVVDWKEENEALFN